MRWCFLLGVLIILMACQPIQRPVATTGALCGTVPCPTSTPTEEPFPTVTPTDEVCGTVPCPTDTPTEEPFSTATPTDNPCGTIPCPTDTPTEELFPTATDTPTPVPTDTPTLVPTDTPTSRPTLLPIPTPILICNNKPATIQEDITSIRNSSVYGTAGRDVIVVRVLERHLHTAVFGFNGNDDICVTGNARWVFIDGGQGRDTCVHLGRAANKSYIFCEREP